MERQDEGNLLAIVDENLCVSCGICIGSCPPLAISFDGRPPEDFWPTDRTELRDGAEVSYVCERHVQQGQADVGGILIPVTCVGMVHPDEIEAVLGAGPGRIRLIACPPDDCANREGNEWTQARLAGSRRPRLAENVDLVRIDLDLCPPGVAAGDPSLEPARFRQVVHPSHWKRLIPIVLFGGLFLIGQLWLTYVTLDAYGDEWAVIEVSMRHRPGRAIEGGPTFEAAFGGAGTRLEVIIDGTVALDRTYGGETVTAFEQIEVAPGMHDLLVVVEDAGLVRMVVLEESRALEERRVLPITLIDAAGGADPGRGEDLFTAATIRGGAGCRVCHSLKPGEDGVGPSLDGVATRATDRIAGVTADEYLRQSILNPDAYVVDGYPSGQMRADAGEGLTADELNDLIEFLLTLR